MSTPQPYASSTSLMLEQHLSVPRLSTYVMECTGRLDDAIELYRWNTEATAAFWEQLSYAEVVLRNTLDARLSQRHTARNRPGTWIDDPDQELQSRARADIQTARDRLRDKGKPFSHAQVVSELSFGFWRFLLTRAYSGSLWPDLAGGFPHAPRRDRSLIEAPVTRINTFRNRLGHHQRIWSEPLNDLAHDLDLVVRYVEPAVADWVQQHSRVAQVMTTRP